MKLTVLLNPTHPVKNIFHLKSQEKLHAIVFTHEAILTELNATSYRIILEMTSACFNA